MCTAACDKCHVGKYGHLSCNADHSPEGRNRPIGTAIDLSSAPVGAHARLEHIVAQRGRQLRGLQVLHLPGWAGLTPCRAVTTALQLATLCSHQQACCMQAGPHEHVGRSPMHNGRTALHTTLPNCRGGTAA